MAKRRKYKSCKCLKWSKKVGNKKRRCLRRSPKGCTPKK